MRAEYHVYSPEGYCCIEVANSEHEARQKASGRPGYQPIDALRVEYYKTYVPTVSRDGLDKVMKRMEEFR